MNNTIIKCPKCNAEYLPAEIFIPNSFLGKPNLIDKDNHGKLIYYNGEDMNLKETYCCDYCNKTFNVSAKVQFQSDIDTYTDFDEDYTTQLKPKGLFMLDEE